MSESKEEVEERSRTVMAYVDQLKAMAAMREFGEPEVWEICSLLQGIVHGWLLMPEGPRSFINIADVEIGSDVLGVHLPYLTIVTGSGKRIRVQVTPEPDTCAVCHTNDSGCRKDVKHPGHWHCTTGPRT